ncbi:nuclear transport factor 2 family protein [Nitratireductor basaltis]|uniref:Ketosteroid isomerase-related protein n=1 Tax=Nitratireductor basaltis TaxID=472175 RepID=A0A084U9K3_9HYPH|nr:nuclear transport factor 2 family protein [Nitratireductor basaltis]KFB09639.1 Ketosteroid isomerase-related protein [Nitratireductor basaltis]
MSQLETRSLVERFLTALNAADWDAATTLVAEDAAIDLPGEERVIGADKLHWYLGQTGRQYRFHVSDLEILVSESGVRAAAEFTLTRNYVDSSDLPEQIRGQSVALQGAIMFEVDDGKITRMTRYERPAE